MPTRSHLAYKVIMRLIEMGRTKEAVKMFGQRTVDQALPKVQTAMKAAGTSSGKQVQEMMNLSPIEEYSKELQKRGQFIKWDGTANSIPSRISGIVDESIKPKANMDATRGVIARGRKAVVSPHNEMEPVYTQFNNPVYEASDAFTAKASMNSVHKQWLNMALEKPLGRKSAIAPRPGGPLGRYDPIKEEVVPYMEKHGDAYFKWLGAQKQAKPDHDAMRALESQWWPAYKELMVSLARKHADVRVFLKTNSSWHRGDKKLIAQVDELLSTKERRLAGQFREYFKRAGDDLEKHKIPIIGKAGDQQIGSPDTFLYTPHLYRAYIEPHLSNVFKGRNRQMKEVLEFGHRSKGSVPLMPSIRASMDWYIPQVNHRIAFQPFHKKWAGHVTRLGKSSGERGQLRDYWRLWFDDALNQKKTKLGDKLVNLYTSVDYIRLIGGSLSVGFKHAMKSFGTYFEHGASPFVQGMGHTVKLGGQLVKKYNMGPGWRGGDLHNALVADRYLKSNIILAGTAELKGLSGLERFVRKLFGFPTTAVEYFDRGTTLYASIIAGSSRNANFHTIHKNIMATILDINFLGGPDAYTWQRKPLMRAATMFTMTPAKILEHKLKLLHGAATRKKDIYGRAVGWKLVRFMTGLGALEYVAQANDMSIYSMVLHLPGIYTDRFGRHTYKGPPAAGHIVSYVNAVNRGDGVYEGLKESFTYWSMAETGDRIARGDLPKMYGDSNWRYALKLPYESLKKKQQGRARSKLRRRKMQSRRYDRRRKKNVGQRALESLGLP